MWWVLFSVWLVSACGGPPLPDTGSEPVASLSFEPSADSSHVFEVTRIRVRGDHSVGAPSLFQGTLSSYYLGKIKQGDLPSPLVARQVPNLSYREQGELVVAPLQILQPGAYSLVTASGVLSEFEVGSALPLLSRFWPSAGTPSGLGFAVYCAASAASVLPSTPGSLAFPPSGSPVMVSAGVDEGGLFSDRCLNFSSSAVLAPDELASSPPAYGDWALGPALFSGAQLEPTPGLSCGAAELAFGPGCARVADDRVLVRTPAAELLWVVHSERGSLAQVTSASNVLTVSGLEPDRIVHLWGEARDLSGAKLAFDLSVRTQVARERLILNEVLADALGPEPLSEWLEIVNDGALAVDLGNYALQDGGGRTALPHALIGPKEYALLVRDDYAPNAADEAPTPSARLIRVPALGKSGFSNAGERLSLVDGSGNERSTIPARKGLPGQSLARRVPSAEDEAPESFKFGVPTPGVPNEPPPAAMR